MAIGRLLIHGTKSGKESLALGWEGVDVTASAVIIVNSRNKQALAGSSASKLLELYSWNSRGGPLRGGIATQDASPIGGYNSPRRKPLTC